MPQTSTLIVPSVDSALSPQTSARFSSRQPSRPMNIIQLCMDEKVDALLVAGDIYDGADRSLQAQLRFSQGLGQLNDAGIASFICHGNHDPLNGWLAQLKRPPLSRQFREAVVPLDPGAPERATIYGFSTRGETSPATSPGPSVTIPNEGFAIGLLHANVGGDTDHANYAPCTIEDLTATDINCWALGHIHKHRVLQHQEPAVVYPGNPRGSTRTRSASVACTISKWTTTGR